MLKEEKFDKVFIIHRNQMHIGLFKVIYFLFLRHFSPILMSLPSSNANISTEAADVCDTNITNDEELLALPAAGEGTARTFSLGETLKLDELGPIIINTG